MKAPRRARAGPDRGAARSPCAALRCAGAESGGSAEGSGGPGAEVGRGQVTRGRGGHEEGLGCHRARGKKPEGRETVRVEAGPQERGRPGRRSRGAFFFFLSRVQTRGAGSSRALRVPPEAGGPDGARRGDPGAGPPARVFEHSLGDSAGVDLGWGPSPNPASSEGKASAFSLYCG